MKRLWRRTRDWFRQWPLKWRIARNVLTYGRQPEGGVKPTLRARLFLKVKRAGTDVWDDIGEVWRGDR